MLKGAYVLATKYNEGDPQDHWVVGWYDRMDGDRHYVLDNNGINMRGNGFRRVQQINGCRGAWLLNNREDIERTRKSLWEWVTVDLPNQKDRVMTKEIVTKIGDLVLEMDVNDTILELEIEITGIITPYIQSYKAALDRLVHACEDEVDDYLVMVDACTEAKKLLPDYKEKEDD